MCEECRPLSAPVDSVAPLTAPPVSRLSRRTFLALGATVGGVLTGLWSCCEGPPPTAGGALTSAALSTTRAGIAPPPPATASETITTQPAAATAPATQAAAPDIGSEVFPDASGKAIANPADAPVIILPRSDWTAARPNLSQIQLMNGINKITVHHTAGQMQADAWKSTARELENIRGFHAGTAATDRNWADIAYHFVVDRAGRVWQARPLAYQGAHVRLHNDHNLGIVLLGDFQVQSPTAAQLWSLGAFIGFARKLYNVPLDQVFTHGELGQTSCPGKTLQDYMNRTRRSWGAAEGSPWNSPGPTTKSATASTSLPPASL